MTRMSGWGPALTDTLDPIPSKRRAGATRLRAWLNERDNDALPLG